MRIVIDTNVTVSGLLWDGPPNQILRWGKQGYLRIVVCEEILSELNKVLHYEKFAHRIAALETTPAEVFAYFINISFYVPMPESVPRIIAEDPFDNIFLSLALENKTSLIVSGDKHLLNLKEYRDIQIVTPNEAYRVIERLSFLNPIVA